MRAVALVALVRLGAIRTDRFDVLVMDAAPQLESLDARLELPPPPTKVVDAYDVADAAAEAAGTSLLLILPPSLPPSLCSE